MRPSLSIPLAALALWLPCAASPQQPDGAGMAGKVHELQLENGWRFLVLPREGAPVVAVETYVAVGAADEPMGLSGLAHMFEHMAFKGSDRVGTKGWEAERTALELVDLRHEELLDARAGGDAARVGRAQAAFHDACDAAAQHVAPEEFSRLLEEAGGAATLNAYTTADAMRYVVSLPSNQLELWCWMERERFLRPVLREFYREREAVLEERALRVDGSPQGVLLEQLHATAFQAHPYGRPTIGFAADIGNYSRPLAMRFFREHFGARNLVTAIVGDVDFDELAPLLRRYLGDVPSGPATRRVVPAEPPQQGERRAVVRHPSEPLVAIGWHVPAVDHPDTPAVEVAVRLLGWSRSSRLERRLIRADGIAAEVAVLPASPGTRHPGIALVLGVPQAGVDTALLERAIYEEIERLRDEGPTPEELAGVQRVARAETLRGLRRYEDVASALTEYEVVHGDWRQLFRRNERLEAVRAADVQRVLARWFTQDGRSVVTLLPPEAGE